jgi:tryptophan halogenase
MSKKIHKVVIVGGGSAGWMSAATMVSQFPEMDISVIESPNIPTVGVGESTIGGINDWMNLIGVQDKDFMAFTDASYKLSIRFTNFYRKDSGSFHYPFGYPCVERKNDWYLKKAFYPETHVSDYAESVYSNMALVMQNKISKNQDNKFPGFVFDKDTAYHFDAAKFGAWLKDNYCIPKGVKYIPAEVNNIVMGATEIDHLELDSGESITADLFIDCTGFRSILMKKMNEPFTSYSDILPNNSAWATRVPYTDKEKEIVGYTDCTAIQNGWVWNIPLWSRLGTGYVYSDKYVSDADALEEFKDYIRSTGKKVEGLEFKNVKMRVGIHERLWVGNVVAIGLSAGFIEPLESTGLYTVHEFLMRLVRSLNRGQHASQWDKDVFNSVCRKRFKDLAQFVAMHYSLSHRDDTEYWRDVGRRQYIPDLIKQETAPYHSAFQRGITQRMETHSFDDNFSGQHCILTGMNYFPIDLQTIIAYNYPSGTDWKAVCDPLIQTMDSKKLEWVELTKDEPTLYEYLKQNFYS